MTTLIELQNLSKSFGEKQVLHNISFKIEENELTTMIGPNGAGKSTIARLLLGLESPSSGKIIILPGLKIGYVPQKLETTKNLPITAEYFLNLLAPNADFITNRDLLEFAVFDRLKNLDISKLSSGQLQKLLLAATLMNNPNLLVMDEPTQSLDVQSQQEFYSLIGRIRKRSKLTIFMISHDLHMVMKNSDQVICVNGHVCCNGRPTNVNHDKNFISALSDIGLYTHHHDHRH